MLWLRSGFGASVACSFLVLFPASARPGTSGAIPSYYEQLNFNLTGPTGLATAAGGFANPGVYAAMPGAELEWYVDSPARNPIGGIARWGGFLSLRGLGLGAVHTRSRNGAGGTASVTDWRLALSGGGQNGSFGVALGWSRGDREFFARTTVVQAGFVHRAGRYLSLGVSGIFSTDKDDAAGLFDVAVRPLGDRRLTLFGDSEYTKGFAFGKAWSAGAMLEVPAGVKLIARYFRDDRRSSTDRFSLALAYTLGAAQGGGNSRLSVQSVYVDGTRTRTLYGGRVGYAERNDLLARRLRGSRFVKLHPHGRVKNSRYRYFDSGVLMSELIESLDAAGADPFVGGVALSLSGTVISRGNAWELREKLAELRRAGKRVIVFFDEGGMTTYHIASVADYVVMDAQGSLILPGYAAGRTYVKRLADRLGLGVEEWRFTDYKSAMESFVRTDMSDEDREQRQSLIDGYHDVFREDVASGRSVDAGTVDRWVNDVTLFTPRTAMAEGLVDTLGRFSDVDAIVRSFEKRPRRLVEPRRTRRYAWAQTGWSRNPEIAVVYALGECAMDTGIRARGLERQIDGLAGDPRVSAVVVRVNSPGGSPLASDLVAQAISRCREKKPVIVSQADVAASGGYWISMTADEIVAQPATITGSIGLIGGWVWDNGFSDRMKLDSDFVKSGEHSDLFVDVRIPFVGVGVPRRGVTDAERGLILGEMKTMYDNFVESVAKARGMSGEEAGRVAKGRVWTGLQALDNGLVDRVGGLDTAIRVARERAGIDRADRVHVHHYNERGVINLGVLRPNWFGRIRGAVWPGGKEAPPVLGGGRTVARDAVPDGERGGVRRDRRALPRAATSDLLLSQRFTEEAAADITLFAGLYDVLYLARLARYAGRPRCALPAGMIPQAAEEPRD